MVSSQQERDIAFMRMAVELAQKGQGRTSPNPCVGAVVVSNGEVVGRGYHHKAGSPHAEILAIRDAGTSCAGATIYVTLEPCNHIGKTPPCSRAVLEAGITRVVIGMADPHKIASGGGAFLKSQGVVVETGVLKQECRALNYPFLKHIATGLPWVVMKAGMSLDGRISRAIGHGGAITSSASKEYVHTLRNRLDAIMIGIGTALIDDPSLTTRVAEHGRDPLRVILDSQLRLSQKAKMLTQSSAASTWVFCSHEASQEKQRQLETAGAVVHRVTGGDEGGVDLVEVLTTLGKANVLSVLVEGGATVHGAFLRAGLYDEVYLFCAPFFIGEGGTPLLNGYSLNDSQCSPLRLADISTKPVGKEYFFHALVQHELKPENHRTA